MCAEQLPPRCCTVLIAHRAYSRSSNAWDCHWRSDWYGTYRGVDVLRLINAAGFLSSRLLSLAKDRKFIDRESYVAQFISLALFTVGVTNSLGNDDLLAAFAAGLFLVDDGLYRRLSFCTGCAISWDGHFNQESKDESFSSVIDLVLNCACFIYIGAWLPFDKFHIPEIGVSPWRLVALVLIILTLRRIPSLLLLYKVIPDDLETLHEALFCGYFGPVGAFYFNWYKPCPLLILYSLFYRWG